MKICHITTVHPRYDIRIFWKECISAARAGNEVILIVNDGMDDEEINGVKILSLKSKAKNRLSRIFSISVKRKAYKKAIELKADIYHFHDPELLGLGKKLKKQGFRVIYDSHEDTPRQILAKEWMPRFARKVVSMLFERYENRCVRMYDAIIVPTPHLKERFSRLHNSVWEVCNFPSLEDISYSGERYSNSNPGCYIGELTYTRGIRQIAEATHKVGIRLNLCGVFHSKGLERELSEKYDNIQYMGFLGRKEISRVLSTSSMGFVTLFDTPNDANSYPIKLFEYMAAGIPVVASDFPVYKEVVEGNNCGICVDPRNIDAICAAINKIRDNKAYADELRNNGYRAVVERYNWESQAEVLMECYNSVNLNPS
ncbi:MAG: glycosyltransferase family 4 protein [Syntrophomonadaceae bacterium]|nr:glycosyltransferase family 4 protein [Syntrophomonadaceae bacterium]